MNRFCAPIFKERAKAKLDENPWAWEVMRGRAD